MTVGFGRFHEKKEEFPEAVIEGMEALNQGFYRTGTYLYQEDAMLFIRIKRRKAYPNGFRKVSRTEMWKR